MKRASLLIFLVWISFSVHAEIITDGSLGTKVNLPGPDFQIDAKLGQQYGGNLFHSFQDFNLQSHESATFSGPNNVQNVINRVTGGNPSNIDGLIRSTIPNADVYFLNPYGIVFGENAQLDVQGSFHASTADYLRLQDGGRFEVRTPDNSLLTVAPVEAFGFLTDSPAPIQTHSSKLSVPADKTLSLIGGDLHLTSDIPLIVDHSSFIPVVTSESTLATEHGRINLASLASHGEVILSDHDLTLQGKGGKITVENTLIELSGYSGGAVFLRAGQFLFNNSIIHSNTFANQNGKDISIKITESAYLNGVNSEVLATTVSASDAGSIFIDTPYLEITNAMIGTASFSEGEAGAITIRAKQAFLKDGASIASGVVGCGDITFHVTERLSLSGFYPGVRMAHGLLFENVPSVISSVSLQDGHSGNITINTQDLSLELGAQISADTHGYGEGGDIIIEAKSVRLVAGGGINSSTHQTAIGGRIKIKVTDQLYLSGMMPVTVISFGQAWVLSSTIDSSTHGTGKGGSIEIEVNRLIMEDKGVITASSSEGKGESGEIYVKANTLHLNGGLITTSAERAGGGNITLTTPNLLFLQKGQIITSVQGGIGNGGNITIEKPQFVILNHGQIRAQADEGRGGNIHIIAEQFIKSPNSLISASSRLGLDGNIQIDSPEEGVSDSLTVLSDDRIDASAMMKKPCSQLTEEDRSHFYVHRINGVRPAPHDRQGSHILPVPPQTIKIQRTTTPMADCQKSSQNTAEIM